MVMRERDQVIKGRNELILKERDEFKGSQVIKERDELKAIKGEYEKKISQLEKLMTTKDQKIEQMNAQQNQVMWERDQVTKERDELRGIKEENKIKVVQLEKVLEEKVQEIKQTAEQRDQIKWERDQLAQRVIELEKNQQKKGKEDMSKVYQKGGLQKVVQFIQQLPSDDLQTLKQHGFKDIDINELEKIFIDATEEFSNAIKDDLTKYPF
eukprot:TRINITY_DN4386_c0_g1_i1.p1 TRINITY_DN4386_c0_g1~~TRINITY_DN4386_c0_g1_i1.p1  ORF type:complete len:211 (-),score=74.95 TRINITY_DN4386_c0_g1_i1:31-663(-)